MKYLIEIAVIAAGMVLVLKTEWIYDFMGPIDWAESKLGTAGGTRIMIKLIGLAMILGSFLAMTGFLGKAVTGFFSPFLKV